MINLNPNIYYKPCWPVFRANPIQNNSAIEKIDESLYLRTIKEEMKRIYNKNKENGVLIQRDGLILERTEGNKEHPFNSKKERLKILQIGKDNPKFIFLHNHPTLDPNGQPRPITPQDAYLVAAYNGAEALVVHPDGTYSSIKFKETREFELCPADALNLATYEISKNDEFRINFNTYGKVRDKWWRDNAEKLGVTYTCTHDFGN